MCPAMRLRGAHRLCPSAFKRDIKRASHRYQDIEDQGESGITTRADDGQTRSALDCMDHGHVDLCASRRPSILDKLGGFAAVRVRPKGLWHAQFSQGGPLQPTLDWYGKEAISEGAGEMHVAEGDQRERGQQASRMLDL
ncbi:hypothetical protein BD310DRAFT_935739 [Dichomitus squalens]|uniref:Uncharacterized protein n=1 Tax=Dichomitus squalens TaxID=114155 RepID=A0A4Q9PK34_9APHY|nr:hypothetical protein BD310DRAFT_935739 [Dichomitus squalens]